MTRPVASPTACFASNEKNCLTSTICEESALSRTQEGGRRAGCEGVGIHFRIPSHEKVFGEKVLSQGCSGEGIIFISLYCEFSGGQEMSFCLSALGNLRLGSLNIHRVLHGMVHYEEFLMDFPPTDFLYVPVFFLFCYLDPP